MPGPVGGPPCELRGSRSVREHHVGGANEDLVGPGSYAEHVIGHLIDHEPKKARRGVIEDHRHEGFKDGDLRGCVVVVHVVHAEARG